MSQLLNRINTTVLTPALSQLPTRMDSPEARIMLLAIGQQESRFLDRWQVVDRKHPEVRGPARGFWQFERNGGVREILESRTTAAYARTLCEIAGVGATPAVVWRQLAEDDLLACGFARLLLWKDPRALPPIGRGAEAWAMYLRNWRPGKPHPSTWNGYYAKALEVIA